RRHRHRDRCRPARPPCRTERPIVTATLPTALPTANVTLAGNANMALYASMVVYTLAMLMFAWHLAARAPRVAASRLAETPAADRAEVLVGAAGSEPAPPAPPTGPYAAGPAFEETLASRQRGNIALM